MFGDVELANAHREIDRVPILERSRQSPQVQRQERRHDDCERDVHGESASSGGPERQLPQDGLHDWRIRAGSYHRMQARSAERLALSSQLEREPARVFDGNAMHEARASDRLRRTARDKNGPPARHHHKKTVVLERVIRAPRARRA